VTAVLALIVVGVDSLAGSGRHIASTYRAGQGPARQVHPPAKPGPATSRLPATSTTLPPPYGPPPVRPVIAPVLTGEGRWTPMDTWDPGPPSILTTTFRPDPADPAITAYAAWIRTSTAEVALYPGYKGPGATNLARGPEMVPVAARSGLLATFNSGFYEADSAAGFYTHGTLYFPMVDGLATLVTYTTGKVDIVDWTGGPTPGAGVVMARQNLPLIVDAGTPAASLDLSFRWGVTLGGVAAVWRTAVGIDARGNLIYVAASGQTAPSLARILVELGAVRGMELDINPEWPIFVTYGGPSAAGPGLFVPNPNQIPDRFLYPSTKDFFAVYERNSAAAGPPW
jgi:Phosphodiester glycosidase